MSYVDRLFRFLSVTALWLVAAMLYVAFFHEGGQWKPGQQGQTASAAIPAKFAVVNADGQPLKIVGEVTLAKPSAPAPAPKVRLNCKLTGALTTAQPSLRLFSDAWKPDREWPLNAKLECETVEHNQ